MIMFFLPWWIYVLIGTVVFTSAFGGIWLAGIAFDRETGDETYPCLAHLGSDRDGVELWCWRVHSHPGPHADQFELPETVFTREWPEDAHECVISLGHTMADESTCFCGPVGAEECDRLRQTNAAGDVIIDENPGYLPGSAPLPSLPQRLSKVPVQTEHNDPWPVCGHSNMNGTCDLAKGHPGDHSFMCY